MHTLPVRISQQVASEQGVLLLTHLVHTQFPMLVHREGELVVLKELYHCCFGIFHTNHLMASFCQPETH